MARSRRMSPGPFFGLRGGGGASFTRKSVAFRSKRWTSPTMRSNRWKTYLGLPETEEHYHSLRESNNYAFSLIDLERFEEAKTLMRKTMPVARRTLGESNDTTLRTRCIYAQAIYRDPAATLDHLRESMTTLEETARTARRVLGGAHPLAVEIERSLRKARAAVRASETPSPSA